MVSNPGASIVTETNASPVFLAEIPTQVDLDASRANRPVTDCDCRGVAAGGGLSGGRSAAEHALSSALDSRTVPVAGGPDPDHPPPGYG
jgi:hypothetical protein